jgi:hypothetical protein
MNTDFYALAMIGVALIAILFLLLAPSPVYKGNPAVCSTVEFNPDMTPEARKRCRELRAIK